MSALTHQSVDVTSIPEVEISNDAGNPVPVSGTVTAIPSGTQDVNVVSTVEVEIKNDAGNPVPVYTAQVAGTPTVTRVSVGAGAPVTLAAADPLRTHVIIHNEAGTLFVKLGATASSTDYTYRLVANSLLDIDFNQDAAVTAIKGAGTTDVQVTLIV